MENSDFSFKTMVEKNLLQENSDFVYINKQIESFLKNKYVKATAKEQTKSGSEKTEEQKKRLSKYYRKELQDKTWMCLRVADHDPNIFMTYCAFTKDKVPSTNKNANICLMFYGYKEISLNKNGSFRVTDKVPVLYIKMKEIKQFRPFNYIVYHFIPGLIHKEDIGLINEMIENWFNGNGRQEFRNPLPTREYVYLKDNQTFAVELNPFERSINGIVKIKNVAIHRRDIRNKNKEKQQNEAVVYAEGGSDIIDDIKIADIVILDDNDNSEIGNAELHYEISDISMDVTIPSNVYKINKNEVNKKTFLSDDEKFKRKQKKILEQMMVDYYNLIREWMNSQ